VKVRPVCTHLNTTTTPTKSFLRPCSLAPAQHTLLPFGDEQTTSELLQALSLTRAAFKVLVARRNIPLRTLPVCSSYDYRTADRSWNEPVGSIFKLCKPVLALKKNFLSDTRATLTANLLRLFRAAISPCAILSSVLPTLQVLIPGRLPPLGV
jgi:hypothetical protein